MTPWDSIPPSLIRWECEAVTNRIEITVPDIGDFGDVPVIEVLVAVGDTVEAEQSLVTLESDKATMEVPAPAAGVIAELRVQLDDTVSEGDVVVVLDAVDEVESASSETGQKTESVAAKKEEQKPAPASEPAAAPAKPAPPSAGSRQTPPVPMDASASLPSSSPYASPAIRRFARELGVDLVRVTGSARGGRIVREDVNAFVKSVISGAATPATGGLSFDLPAAPKVKFSRYGEIETLPLSRIQKISGAYLHRNWLSIPHVTQNDLADITEMEVFRKANAEKAKEQGFKLTPLVFMIKAAVAALKEFPIFNASLDETGENLILKKFFHIGIAVDTPDGLVVPVIRDCEQKDIFQLAGELGELSQTARDGKLKPTDMQGGCFSISSLGGIGGTSFTPIINAPEVAILGVSRSSISPKWDGEAFQPRMMLPLSLSYDHRVIDGANAARFARFLAASLEDFESMDL
ncbi:MAG: dihydrolipoyllysine-residue acetyltransferase [Xanthomonadales bacterium]|nr:dihydrolipoyllysine-residue acetyltransferase [Xanthomonadales bacterium]